MRLAVLQNEIANGDLEASEDVHMQLTDSEKTQHSNEWRTFRERNANLAKHWGQTYSLILGQCSQLLKDKMKQDTDWPVVSGVSYDPLTLYRLIGKTILAQTEDQYPFATVYDQEISFYGYRQENMTNSAYYDRFNTKADVGDAIRVTRQRKSLLEYVAQELVPGSSFDKLAADKQKDIRTDAEERYISYAFLRQNGNQHEKL